MEEGDYINFSGITGLEILNCIRINYSIFFSDLTNQYYKFPGFVD
jgi:hypothetical protein